MNRLNHDPASGEFTYQHLPRDQRTYDLAYTVVSHVPREKRAYSAFRGLLPEGLDRTAINRSPLYSAAEDFYYGNRTNLTSPEGVGMMGTTTYRVPLNEDYLAHPFVQASMNRFPELQEFVSNYQANPAHAIAQWDQDNPNPGLYNNRTQPVKDLRYAMDMQKYRERYGQTSST